jgi:exo-1,4-beta-D-glucosaminidase
MSSPSNGLHLKEAWHICNAADLKIGGEIVSTTAQLSEHWLPTSVPSTVLAALVANEIYVDPFLGTNLRKIPTEQFENPWWYRTEFHVSEGDAGKVALLEFDGVNYSANVWLNGIGIASQEEITGTYRQFQLKVSEHICAGANVLAVEIIPPRPGDFSVGFVDWNPWPPDGNMGIFRDVRLRFVDSISIEKPFVQTDVDIETLQEARLTVTAEVANQTSESQNGVLHGRIGTIEFQQVVALTAEETQTVEFSPDTFAQLTIQNPELWWPNNLGEPVLHELQFEFKIDDAVSDFTHTAFGIRDVQDYLTEDGHRGYRINGKNVLIKGGGWADDIFLSDTPRTLEAQVRYSKHMNFNCIRLEGFWGSDHTLYDLCDQHGLLIMVGWSCHWEHEEHLGKPVDARFGGVFTPEDIALIAQSWEDQVIWLRNHPSIFVWTIASDKVPKPELEQEYVKTFAKYDSTRPYLNSTGGVGSDQNIIGSEEVISEISGPSGVKMLGPYAYTPPVYWYTDTKLGGAYGFNTETGPGAQVPPLESIKKMIPEDHLWPIDDVWYYHCGRHSFGTLERYEKAIDQRFGAPNNVEEFAQLAQVLNYELMRPMFEAFQTNKGKATGLIQWMLNSAWPEMYWQLYNHDLMPTGAFYAARKACEPLHLLFNYGDNGIYFINDLQKPVDGLTASIRVFDINAKVVHEHQVSLSVEADSSTRVCSIPENLPLSSSWFLDLRLMKQDGTEVGNNFYWLSTKPDVLDYEAETGAWQFYTPSREYADFKLLRQLPQIELDVQCRFESQGDITAAMVELANNSPQIAFFNELAICGTKSGATILPVFWEDNYISLVPNESRTVKATFGVEDLGDDQPMLKLNGWNATAKKDA